VWGKLSNNYRGAAGHFKKLPTYMVPFSFFRFTGRYALRKHHKQMGMHASRLGMSRTMVALVCGEAKRSPLTNVRRTMVAQVVPEKSATPSLTT
jgi:hypothetical protein